MPAYQLLHSHRIRRGNHGIAYVVLVSLGGTACFVPHHLHRGLHSIPAFRIGHRNHARAGYRRGSVLCSAARAAAGGRVRVHPGRLACRQVRREDRRGRGDGNLGSARLRPSRGGRLHRHAHHDAGHRHRAVRAASRHHQAVRRVVRGQDGFRHGHLLRGRLLRHRGRPGDVRLLPERAGCLPVVVYRVRCDPRAVVRAGEESAEGR